jgi:hypothetical protein
MSNWVVAVLILNAALVVAIIVLALKIAGRKVLVAVEVTAGSTEISTVDSEAIPSSPRWSQTQMTRTEWRFLLDACDAARAVYVRELTAWRNEAPRLAGALTEATHDYEVAKRRLTRFELDVSVGPNRGPRQRFTYLRRLTPN